MAVHRLSKCRSLPSTALYYVCMMMGWVGLFYICCDFIKSFDLSFQGSHPSDGDDETLSIILGGCEVQVRNVLKSHGNYITLKLPTNDLGSCYT